jgi:hypothetical protein
MWVIKSEKGYAKADDWEYIDPIRCSDKRILGLSWKGKLEDSSVFLKRPGSEIEDAQKLLGPHFRMKVVEVELVEK